MSECPEQWKLDVNERYQAAVSIVSSLATAALVLPIFFLKDVSSPGSGRSIADSLSCWVYWGWFLLGAAILAAVVYQYSSAKWAKLAWKQKTDMFGVEVNDAQVEHALDISYSVMMVSFAAGVLCMVTFMVTFTPPAKDAQQQVQRSTAPPSAGPRP